MQGQLCTVGNFEKLFYYAVQPALLIEVLKKRHGVPQKHLVRLVDGEGKPITLPPGARFEHVNSGEEVDLLDIFLRSHGRQEGKASA